LFAERPRKPGRNYEICREIWRAIWRASSRRERLHRAACRVGRPVYSEPCGDADDFRRTEPGAKSSQSLDPERGAVREAAPEGGGLARECVKDQNHQGFSLSRVALTSKIAPVEAHVNSIVTQARRIVRARPSR